MKISSIAILILLIVSPIVAQPNFGIRSAQQFGGGAAPTVGRCGNRFFTCNYGSNIRFYTLSDSNFSLQASVGSYASVAAVSDSLLIFTNSVPEGSSNYSLVMYNIANINAPIRLDSIGFNGRTISGITIHDSLIYVAFDNFYFRGMKIYTFGSPPRLNLVSSCSTANGLSRIQVANHYAYLADIDAGIMVYDVSNLSFPTYVNTIYTNDDVYDLVVDSTYLFAAVNRSGILVYDISNPRVPVFVNRIDTPGQALKLDVQLPHIFCSDYDRGIRLFYIADIMHPVLIGNYLTPQRAMSITAIGDIAVVGTTNGTFSYNCSQALSVQETSELLPNKYSFTLHPNPFNSTLTVRFDVPKNDAVTIKIFDALGRVVETMHQGQLSAGRHEIRWHADHVSAGVYFISMKTPGFVSTKKAILLK